MTIARWIAACAALGGWAPLSAGAQDTLDGVSPHAALLDAYCLGCHSTERFERGDAPIALDTLDPADVARDAEAWETVVRKVRTGQMPPSGARRPDGTARDGFVRYVESALDRAAAAAPDPGRTEALHRLNRAEYRNAIRDLLDLDVDPSAWLPSDDASYGFDNIAGVLGMSPTLMERYLNAAREISRVAVGTPPSFPAIDYYRVADDLSQDAHLTGLSLGTRGGAKIRYTFPMDAEYTIRVELTRDLNESLPYYPEPQHLEISIDGERVHVFAIEPNPAPPPEPASAEASAQGQEPQISQVARRGPRLTREERAAHNRVDREWEIRIPVQAGARDVQAAFVRLTSAVAETARLPFFRPYPGGVNIPESRLGNYLRGVEISGPYDPTGPGDTASRRRIFACRPGPGATPDEEAACAGRILGTLARRAYRRPVTGRDLEPLLEFFRRGRAEGGFDDGIERGLGRLLVSPEFLFRVTADPPGAAPGEVYAIDDVELASRLSFFLWSSIPDNALLELAEAGRLSEPDVLEAEVRRMIRDERFDAFVENFAGQWLFLRNLEATVPVQYRFPDFDDALRQAFRRETELFFESVAREDRSARDLLRADYTFLNERLAVHYGIPNVKGSHFRRVTLDAGGGRSGLLGHGSVLTVTSYPDRTSPVVRGKWILENLFGSPPPDPPAMVPELEPSDTSGDVLSMRERIAQHRANPVCASCHATMDPLGLALENFDAVGRWRTLEESGAAIDATGALPDGTRFEGAEGLRQALLSSDLFVVTLTEKMLTYALGRGLEYHDGPAVREIVRDAAGGGYRMQSLIAGIVRSVPFRMRTAGPAAAE